MNINEDYAAHARALQAEIASAPGVWLPRREDLLKWLETFLQRVEDPTYTLGESEAADLAAVEKYLRTRLVPAA